MLFKPLRGLNALDGDPPNAVANPNPKMNNVTSKRRETISQNVAALGEGPKGRSEGSGGIRIDPNTAKKGMKRDLNVPISWFN